jgi:dihydropteroate synthase
VNMKLYYRPLAYVFGRDAAKLIHLGQAGALGGLLKIGFTQVEIIERGKASYIIPFAELANESPLGSITMQRPHFGGLSTDRTRVMGIVNVTPDSFSDGGRLVNSKAAIGHGHDLAREGADILDIGGESTRPGSDTVSAADEIDRVQAVIAALAVDHLVSADTRKPEVMRAALAAGARIINDVSALGFDQQSAAVIAAANVPVILMHAQGEPKTMQLNPRYENVLLDVYDALAAAIAKAEAAGIKRANICIDPGIGFGKTFKQNLELMAGLSLFHGLGVPVLAGSSRKGFIGAVTGEKLAANRVYGSVGSAIQAAMQGVQILRVHDVKATVHALKMFTASNDPDSADF